MDRAAPGSSAREAEDYLVSVFSACTGFELAVVTSAEASSRKRLRECLARAGAEITVVPPELEQVLGARQIGTEPTGHRSFVLWIESETDADDQRWRELVAALNRSRQRLMNQHRYLWVVAGPYSLQRIMTRQGQDLYSGAYKVPHVVAHAGAELRWLHLSDLQLGGERLDRGARQGGDVWRSVEELLLPDLARMIDDLGAGPELVLVSGDLAAAGQSVDYEHVDRCLDRVLDELERRTSKRPLLLAVPGNHDVERPADPLGRWPFEVLRRHDDEGDAFAHSLREHLWVRKDAGILELLFPAYAQWARRRVLDALQLDQLGMEAGVVYVRSVVRSHIPGDWSVVIEKDDFRLGIVGLNTAWTSFDDEVGAGCVVLPFEQIEAALGSDGVARWVGDTHWCMLLTHHGPEWLSKASDEALTRIQPLARFAVHLCGPRHAGVEVKAQATAVLVERGYPLFAWGIAQAGRPSGYRVGRIGRDGQLESRIRVLEPIPARGAWRYVDGVEAASSTRTRATESHHESWWPGALRSYLDALVSRHGMVSLMGFETRLRVPLRLDELHVPLDAILDLGGRERRVFGSAAEAEAEHEGLSIRGHEVALVDALASATRMGRRGIVILGDPGSGKTMQLARMLLKVVQDGPESIGLPVGTVPVFLSLRELRSLEQTLEAFVAAQLDELGLRDVGAFAHTLVHDHGKVLYLLDGLDEVVGRDLRVNVSRWIDRQLELHPQAWFAVTCRYAGYHSDTRLPARFLELHLRPLTLKQSEEFVRRWFSIVEGALAVDPELGRRMGEDEATALLEAMQAGFGNQRVAMLTRNPLLLTTICLVHRDRGKLPQRRVELYDECVRILLESWREAKDLPVSMPAVAALRVLQPVALWLHEVQGRQKATAQALAPVIEEALAAEGVTKVVGGAEAFLRSIRDESGLLTGWSGDHYGFMHLAFQEYLAARELRRRGFDDPAVLQALAGRFGEAWWQEVILLMLGLDDPPIFERFMDALVKRPELSEWVDSEMMALCLGETSGQSSRPFVRLVRDGDDQPRLIPRQLAALRVLARTFPAALVGLAESLCEHPAQEVRAWWTERQHAEVSDER
jgi:NACHT domain/Calcineurin-like phosphoesterase